MQQPQHPKGTYEQRHNVFSSLCGSSVVRLERLTTSDLLSREDEEKWLHGLLRRQQQQKELTEQESPLLLLML